MESLLPLLLIFAVMMLPMLFISNRQRKAQMKQAELVRQLGVGAFPFHRWSRRASVSALARVFEVWI